MIASISGIFFLVICFLHGVFASGFIPILNKMLGTSSTMAFSLYFVGIFLGQLSIYRFKKLSAIQILYPLYEIGFGLSLIFMAIYMNHAGLLIGRFVEGVFAGLALPLLFANILNNSSLGNTARKVVMFNSVFALGFVIGPISVTYLIQLLPASRALLIFGVIFILVSSVFLVVRLPRPLSNEKKLSFAELSQKKSMLRNFYTLFIAKMFYGFLLTFTTAYLLNFEKNLTLYQSMLLISLLFVVGQILVSLIIKIYPKELLEQNVPMFLGITLLAFYFTSNTFFFFLAVLFHAFLAFIGYLNFGKNPGSGREFALFNSISDPAMIIGSLIAYFGIAGTWILFIPLSIPLILFIIRPHNQVRAERFFPFIGPLILFKVLKRQKNPLKIALDDITVLKIEKYEDHSEGEHITIALTGDFCPSLIDYKLDPEIKDFLKKHDIRVLNLEGTQTTTVYDHINKKLLFDIPKNQFENIVYDGEKYPIFNVLSLSNNHLLDRGVTAFSKTIEHLNDQGNLTVITNDLVVRELKGIKIGFFAWTYGLNMFFRSHEKLSVVKPERFYNDLKFQEKMLAVVKSYKSQVDFLVLSYHWGYECEYYQSKLQEDCFSVLSKAGVDLIYGHHSHIVQPFQLSADKKQAVLYSCGNFISDMELPVYKKGVIYSITLVKEKANQQLSFKKIEPMPIEMKDSKIIFSHSWYEH